ncbi:MAG: response regulator [Bacillota bacterium]
MSADTAKIKKDNVVIVDSSDFMRRILKNMILDHSFQIFEASDNASALRLAANHNPKVVFVSMEGNQNWPSLVKSIKSRGACRVVAYSTGITRESVASAYFAGVDEILASPQNQKERVEKCLITGAGIAIGR